MPATTCNTRNIHVARAKVYHAFTDRQALEYWLAPHGMTGQIHDFDLRVGGGYTMSLFYQDNETAGKTAGNEDRFTARFTELIPCEKVTQTIHFQSEQAEFAGEMTMEVFLAEIANDTTAVAIVFKNIPSGIRPEDNEAGTEQSLEKLARYLENRG